MNSMRCVGLLLVMLLSACDGDKAPAPAPKVAGPAVSNESAEKKPLPAEVRPDQPAATPAAPAVVETAKPAATEHRLAPNVAVVPVVASSKPDAAKPPLPVKTAPANAKAASGNAKSAKVKADNAEVARRAPVASKSKNPAQVVKETRLPKAALDLSLPPEMVKQLAPPPGVITAGPATKSKPAGAKPLLPKMFPDTESDPDFQLQGRLLSNEMQLQLRNESRKEVEGAALDFKFKQ